MAESEQIWWTYVKLENRAEIYSARIYSRAFKDFFANNDNRNRAFDLLTTTLG